MKDRYGDPINFTWCWQRLKHFFGIATGHDENFGACEAAADELGSEESDERAANKAKCADPTSTWYGDPTEDARTIERVEALVVGPAIRGWLTGGEEARDEVWREAPERLGMTQSDAAFALELWDGGLTAAKCIASSTRSGRNWPWWRYRFAKRIDARSAEAPVFGRGVRAAVAFKEGRKEPWSFWGVPPGSMVRKAANR